MEIENYQDILKMELADRIAKNSSYSLRAMAKQTNLSPSMLSAVLNGKKELSVERAFDIGKILKFDKIKHDYFVTLVQWHRSKSEEQKIELFEKLNSILPQPKHTVLTVELFKIIAEWYHLSILELTNVYNFDLTSENASAALGISKFEAQSAIDRLLRLDLLEKNKKGKLQKTSNVFLSNSNVPNSALRKYHEQTLSKAITSITTQTPADKFIGSETFAFDVADLKIASEIIEDCFSKITALAGKNKNNKNKKSVYHMGVQLFNLTKEIS